MDIFTTLVWRWFQRCICIYIYIFAKHIFEKGLALGYIKAIYIYIYIYIYMSTHQNVCFKYVQFIVYQLLLNAAAAMSLQSCPTLCDPIDPTRLRPPWDSPGKNTGVGCHFLFRCMKVKALYLKGIDYLGVWKSISNSVKREDLCGPFLDPEVRRWRG